MSSNPLQTYPIVSQPRIVSLIPSATEIVSLLGAQSLLVGRTHECDFPPCVTQFPALTSPSGTADSPPDIDRQVRERLHANSRLCTLDESQLVLLRPDLIVTQGPCDVCTVDLADVRRAVRKLDPEPTVLTLNPTTIEGVIDDVLRVAIALERPDQGKVAAASLRERLFAASEFVNAYVDGPSVAFLEWTDPLFCAGHWTVQLIERAGGWHPLNPTTAKPASGAAAGPQMAERVAGKSIRISPEIFVATRPEFLIICPCGFNLNRTRRAARDLAQQAWFRGLPAVQNDRVALVDGLQMFNRPGPRLIDAFEWLVGWLHDRPELIPPNFPWEPFQPE